MQLGSFFRITYTKDPQEAARLGYRNPGTDRRIAGELGAFIGGVQAALSYKSPIFPTVADVRTIVVGDNVIYVQTEYDPQHPQNVYYKIAMRRDNGRWATVRIGFHYDANWGDANSVPEVVNPTDSSIVGGYIFDVILKLNATQSFIDGVE